MIKEWVLSAKASIHFSMLPEHISKLLTQPAYNPPDVANDQCDVSDVAYYPSHPSICRSICYVLYVRTKIER